MWALVLTLLLRFQITPARSTPVREDVLARTIVAAVAANDFERLRPLFPAELVDVNADNFKQLRRKSRTLKVDLAKAKILRVETTGTTTRLVDSFLAHDGRQYKTQFSTDGTKLLAIASWLVDVTKNEGR